MMKVKTPVRGFTGAVAGVQFLNGEGKTNDPVALAYFRRHGYVIEGASEDATAGDEKGEPEAEDSTDDKESETDAKSAPKQRPRTTAKK